VTVTDVDFTPALAEREAARAELRSRVYARAKEELQRLNHVYADRTFRIRRIDFTDRAYPHERVERLGRGVSMMAEAAPPPRPVGPEGVAERVVISAIVVLAAVPPRRDDDDDDD
jgi:hypothetical protein